MKKLANVLYVTSPDSILGLEDEALTIKREDQPTKKLPLLNLQGIVCFNYVGVSPFLMGECVKRNIGLTFLTPNGRFWRGSMAQFRQCAPEKQYATSEDPENSLKIAKTASSEKSTTNARCFSAQGATTPAADTAQFDTIIQELKELLKHHSPGYHKS